MQAEILVHGNRYGTAQIIQYWNHLHGYNQLQSHIENESKELKIQDHIFEHPEFFGHGWQPVAKNQSLQVVIQKLDEKIDRTQKELKKRADLVLRQGNEILVVEIMRPKLRADRDHVLRTQTYKAYLAGYLPTYRVRGLLIAEKSIDPGVLQMLSELPNINIQFCSWDQFIEKSNPKFRCDVIWYIDNAVNKIAGLLPPASDPSVSWEF